ncbi:M14 family zinc carboxypeptidase [Winogradskyella tangerina]|uniref:M14 family zinc carboxypeptidase n=1 Tax=Winogradskyella tangerina TaxID=2023240 RepID=UPI000DBE35FA|nr:M14 family zinc carboxypeptidase [Winogradskyella tangerina]
MKKITLCLTAILLSILAANSQELTKHEIDELLSSQGELTFEFKIDDKNQIKELSKSMTIVTLNNETNLVKVWANNEQFQNFLTLDIPFKVYKEDNDVNDRLMSNDLSLYSRAPKPGYTLEFPMTVYPTYADYAAQMQNFETEHSDIVDFFSIGTTGQGDKELLFVKISDNVSTDETEPKLLYTSSMHGDEIAGFPMMLNLIDYIITAYKDNTHADHTRIFNLVNGSEIWINPNANPDGTYHLSSDNTSVANARRGNGNNVDLNRNYPDNLGGAHTDGQVYQTETLAFMQLAEDHHFVISANFHGGIELVNYPWDNTYDRHPDDSWFILTAGEYRDNAQNDGPAGYMDDENNGITHGADWYLVNGGRQDFMNHDHHCKEVTIELSNTKKPPANQLDDFWNYNREALLDYLVQGTYGFNGFVKDASTGNPIEGATITAVGHDALGSWTVSDVDGDYYRPIFAGTYDLLFEAPCYQSVTLSSETIGNYQSRSLADVLMTPLTPTVPNSLNVTNIVSSSVTLNWTVTNGSSFDIRYREVGASTWIDILDVDSTSYDLSGLNPETDYEYEVRSNCGSNTSAYSTADNFTTGAVVYCNAEGSNINDEYIGEVSLNGITNNSVGSTSAGYSNYKSLSIFNPMEAGSSGHTISVMKYWDGTQYNEAVSAWIDYSQDGIFTNDEKILEAGAFINPQTVSNTFDIPNTAKTGNTVMRVIMKYYNNANEGTFQTDPCETFTYGEVEDYTVNISEQTLGIEELALNDIKIFPNPFTNDVEIKIPSSLLGHEFSIDIYDSLSRLVYSESIETLSNDILKLSNLNAFNNGTYLLQLRDVTSNQTIVKQLIKQ